MIKILFSDFDSTFAVRGRVPKKNIEAVRRLHENGIDFALVSGRPAGNLKSLFKRYKIKGNFIASNGAVGVLYDQGPVFVHSMDKETAMDLIQLSRKKHWFYLFYGVDVCYLGKLPHRILKYTMISSIISHLYGMKMRSLSQKNSDSKDFPKLTKMNIYMGESNFESLKKLLDKDPRIRATNSSRRKLEVNRTGVSKWAGIQEMAKFLDLSLDEIACIGDYDNDIDMLKNARYSFAVANCSPGAREAAKFHVKACKDGGFSQACDFIIEKNRLEKEGKKTKGSSEEESREINE